ncbi:ARF [Musa troglodytarum]|uniref:ARF n=1 Tax=Musa troglodytarum TaxID=320322 RepID=A0A9E7ID07_9LILI|nr:ARF [Musa troglodytarum]
MECCFAGEGLIARFILAGKDMLHEGGFDLDMTYITENIIAMGFPAGDMSSGFFGYVEGFYRNHMEEVIKFFETHHKGKYKVYNLCSERLYDASLFEGKVACFPFDDHNCPPIQLIISFCQSAYSWLKEDIENVVVVHCKAGMARTGLMISSLLLYLKFFPTAEESMEYYNQKRCIDGKGLVLPSQIRYVKYFERILTYFDGENQPGRSWLNTTFMENRKILNTSDLDGFDKRKLPSPGFQVEVVLVNYDGSNPPRQISSNANKESAGGTTSVAATKESSTPPSTADRDSGNQDKDDVFSDSEAEETGSSKSKRDRMVGDKDGTTVIAKGIEIKSSKEEAATISHDIRQISLKDEAGAKKNPDAADVKIEGSSKSSIAETPELESTTMSEFKAIAADASVFSFGDDEDYDSE